MAINVDIGNGRVCTNAHMSRMAYGIRAGPAGDMPRTTDLPDEVVQDLAYFWDHYSRRNVRPDTVKATFWNAVRCIRALREAGMTCDPRCIGPAEIEYLRDVAFRDLCVTTTKWYVSVLGTYCKIHGNDVVDSMELRWAKPYVTPHIDWLDPADAKVLLMSPKTVPQQTALMLMLNMGLRRVEVIRLRVEDIGCDGINVIGKGFGGGKLRPVLYVGRDMHPQLLRMIRWREDQIARVRERNPDVEVPPNLFLWDRAGELHPFAEAGTGFDKCFLRPVRDETGIQYSNHTLRRTFARELYFRGLSLMEIGTLLGHESIAVTRDYIGVGLSLNRRGIDEISLYGMTDRDPTTAFL